MADVWTIDELVDRVRAALATEYTGAPNGRVRDIPDRRAIRWYATRGLVDRPIAMRGRTALYGRRHLLQLVALKRRQAEGHTLAEIQAELTGAPDATLAVAARVPDDLLDDPPAVAMDVIRPRFWAQPGSVDSALMEHRSASSVAAPATRTETPRPARPDVDSVSVLTGVPLVEGALLLLAGTPAAADLAAIRSAARPLIDLLGQRGLLDPAHGPSIL